MDVAVELEKCRDLAAFVTDQKCGIVTGLLAAKAEALEEIHADISPMLTLNNSVISIIEIVRTSADQIRREVTNRRLKRL